MKATGPTGSNPLQMLFSLNIPADWKFVDTTESKKPSFIASITHQGQNYTGQGRVVFSCLKLLNYAYFTVVAHEFLKADISFIIHIDI